MYKEEPLNSTWWPKTGEIELYTKVHAASYGKIHVI